MGEECSDGSCSSDEHSGSDEKCGCQSGQCGSECGCGSEPDMFDTMMYLAHKAKIELLKDKMKKRLELQDGKKFDQIAEIIVEALLETKKEKAEMHRRMEELREKLNSVLEQR